MPYSPVDLGHIILTASAIKNAQQQAASDQLRQQYLGQQIQAGQQQMDQSAQANTQAQQAMKSKQVYAGSQAVLQSADPKGTAEALFPDFVKDFDSQHGEGAWQNLPPDQVKALAGHLRDRSAMDLGLSPPTKLVTHGDINNPGAGITQENPETGALSQVVAPQRLDPMEALKIKMQQQQIDETARHNKVKEASDATGQNPLGIGAPTSTGAPSQANGDQFLQTLPKNIGDQVKALAEGRMAFPSGMALKTPYWQQMITAVSQYDPNFDAVNYNARSKTRNDFTSGKNAQNIKALNTAIGHLGTLNDQIDATASHGGFPFATTANAIQNEMTARSGGSGPTNFNQTASALASELTQVFRGSGGAEADIKRYLDELNVNASSEQKRAAVKNIANLLHSRTAAIGDQYNQGMGTTNDPLTLLNPHAQGVINKINSVSQPQQAAPQEVTATGPNGQQIVLRNGQWVPRGQ